MNEIGQALLTTLLIDFGIQFVAFAFSAYLHTEKFYDLAGSITYQSAIIYGLVNANIKHGTSARQFMMAICGLVWALRLGMFLFVRVLRHTDKRFDQLKNDPIKFTIPWVLQVIWIYITAFPIYLICANDASLQAPIQTSDIFGLIIWIFGFTVEAVADHQKFKFKNENPRDFMKTGLFQYSRYPNYFGEVVLWYGMWIISIGGYEQSWQWVSVISPLFVTALLYFGSGVALGETNALKNYGSRADYQEYRAKTNKFVPWFPKKNATIPFPADEKIQNIAKDAINTMQKGVQSVLPKSLEEECLKCAEIIKKFAKPEDAKVKVQLEKMSKNEILGSIIPKDIVQNAKGIAIMQIVKAGFGFSGRGGTGLVMAKLPNGEWSAPSAIGSGGIGIGWQIGAQVTDTVFILNTVEAVDAFFNPNFTLGGSLGVSAGPFGRSAELSGEVASKFAPIYSYSNSKGLFAGVSFEGSVILERKETNTKFYGEQISAKEILSGFVPRPEGAAELYRALAEHFK